MHCKSNDPINEFLPLLYFWSKLKMIVCQVPINEKEWEVEFLFHEEHWKSIAVQNVNHAFSNQRIFCDHENIVNVFCPQGEKRRNCHRGKHKQKESLSFFLSLHFLETCQFRASNSSSSTVCLYTLYVDTPSCYSDGEGGSFPGQSS